MLSLISSSRRSGIPSARTSNLGAWTSDVGVRRACQSVLRPVVRHIFVCAGYPWTLSMIPAANHV
jgi:hypothetical protein